MEYWRLLAHNHWVTLDLRFVKVRLCARCSGYLTSLVVSLFLIKKFEITLSSDPIFISIVVLALALPLIIDWVTQSWGWRQSTNKKRLLTGLLMGSSVALFSMITWGTVVKELVFTFLVVAVFLLGHR